MCVLYPLDSGTVNRRIGRVGRITPDAMQAHRTPSRERVSRRAIVLNWRIVKVLTLFVVIIPRPALCDRSPVDSIKGRDAGIRKVLEEVDPKDDMDCLSMGELDIVFRTDNHGVP